MAQAKSVVIDSEMAEFIDAEIARGNYRSSGEVVSAGLHLLRENEAKLAALRAAIAEGDASGEPEDFDFDKFIAEYIGE